MLKIFTFSHVPNDKEAKVPNIIMIWLQIMVAVVLSFLFLPQEMPPQLPSVRLPLWAATQSKIKQNCPDIAARDL